MVLPEAQVLSKKRKYPGRWSQGCRYLGLRAVPALILNTMKGQEDTEE